MMVVCKCKKETNTKSIKEGEKKMNKHRHHCSHHGNDLGIGLLLLIIGLIFWFIAAVQ